MIDPWVLSLAGFLAGLWMLRVGIGMVVGMLERRR